MVSGLDMRFLGRKRGKYLQVIGRKADHSGMTTRKGNGNNKGNGKNAGVTIFAGVAGGELCGDRPAGGQLWAGSEPADGRSGCRMLLRSRGCPDSKAALRSVKRV